MQLVTPMVDTEIVADALIQIYSRIGFPKDGHCKIVLQDIWEAGACDNQLWHGGLLV